MHRLRLPAVVRSGLLLLLAAFSANLWAQGASNFTPEWVKRSNEIAYQVLEMSAGFVPEFAGQMGVDGLDEEVFDLRPELYERQMAVERQKIAFLEGLLETEVAP